MPNRTLSPAELIEANRLLNDIRQRLTALANNDPELLFAYRRKVFKELTYDERSGPTLRRKLKLLKRKEQNNQCPLCAKELPEKYAVLDRIKASDGYTPENTRLIHQTCDIEVQLSRGYA